METAFICGRAPHQVQADNKNNHKEYEAPSKDQWPRKGIRQDAEAKQAGHGKSPQYQGRTTEIENDGVLAEIHSFFLWI